MEAGGGMVYPAQTLDGELATRCPDMASWIRDHVAPVVTRDPHHALDTADPGPSAGADSGGQGLEISKPKISFRKRKVISVRERTDDD